MPSDVLSGLLADKTALGNVLKRHVLPKVLYSQGICWNKFPTLAEDESLRIEVGDDAVTVATDAGGAKVVTADISATNGVIHEIDSVI